MPDLMDAAQELEQLRSEMIQEAARSECSRPSERWCHGCGDEIPMGRRKAVPGVQQCIACATAAQRRAQLFARPR